MYTLYMYTLYMYTVPTERPTIKSYNLYCLKLPQPAWSLGGSSCMKFFLQKGRTMSNFSDLEYKLSSVSALAVLSYY